MRKPRRFNTQLSDEVRRLVEIQRANYVEELKTNNPNIDCKIAENIAKTKVMPLIRP